MVDATQGTEIQCSYLFPHCAVRRVKHCTAEDVRNVHTPERSPEGSAVEQRRDLEDVVICVLGN